VTRPPFPFFVGCGRSGTTLVRALVDGHPDMAVPPESHVVVALAPGPNQAFSPGAFADALAASDRFALWDMDRAAVATAVDVAGAGTYADAVRAVFAAWAARRGKARYADKTPGYVVHIPALAALFPEATFVQVVRDGRDVAASFVELGWAPGPVEAALHWRLRVLRGRRAGRALAEGRYHELRYEDLVADPEAALRRLCAAIDLPFDSAMLDHTGRAAEVVGSTSHPGYHRHLDRPVTAGLRDWRRDLPDDAVVRIEAAAGDALAQFGYEPSGLRAGARVRAEVAAARVRWELHRVRSRLRRG
jgi:hypothetical protein